jgi:hypothetical protein
MLKIWQSFSQKKKFRKILVTLKKPNFPNFIFREIIFLRKKWMGMG